MLYQLLRIRAILQFNPDARERAMFEHLNKDGTAGEAGRAAGAMHATGATKSVRVSSPHHANTHDLPGNKEGSTGHYTVGGKKGSHTIPAPGEKTAYDTETTKGAKYSTRVDEKLAGVRLTQEEINHNTEILWQRTKDKGLGNSHWYDEESKNLESVGQQLGFNRTQTMGIAASMSPLREWGKNRDSAISVMQYVHMERSNAPEDIRRTTTHITPEIANDFNTRNSLHPDVNKDGSPKFNKDGSRAMKKGFIDTGETTKLPVGEYDIRNSKLDPIQLAAVGHLTLLDPHGNPLSIERNTLNGASGVIHTAKAFKIARGDGSLDSVHNTLSGAKVRSFFNNLHAPSSPEGHVTIDSWMTEAMAGGKIDKLLGSPKMGGIAPDGLGVYPAFADPLRTIAKREGLQPHQVQSGMWEMLHQEYQFKREGGRQAILDRILGHG